MKLYQKLALIFTLFIITSLVIALCCILKHSETIIEEQSKTEPEITIYTTVDISTGVTSEKRVTVSSVLSILSLIFISIILVVNWILDIIREQK